MKHASTKDISEFLDGTLSVARMRQIALHLEACSLCLRELEAFKKTRAMLGRLPRPEGPTAEFWAKTMDLLQVEEAAKVPAYSFNTKKVFRTAASTFAAAATLVVAVFVVGHLPPVGPSPDTGGSSQVADSINDQDMSSFVKAHTEAAELQPLSDGDHQVMLAADIEEVPNSNSSAGDSADYGDATP